MSPRAPMGLVEAWSVLGKDASQIFGDIRSFPSREARVRRVEEFLETAKKLARKLMASSHPDRGQPDLGAGPIFARVQEALACIDAHTKMMVLRNQEIEKKMQSGRDGLIVIEK